MSVHEATVGLLSHLLSRKLRAIDKVERRVYGFVLGFNMKWNIFYGDQVYLHRIEFLSIKFCKERQLTCNLKVQVVNLH